MKKTILAALAAIVFVSPASALELPEGVTCTDLFWHTKNRVNPTELSDYQECVIATNWPDQTSGAMGDLFWVKLGEYYYSTSFSLLRKSFRDEDKALKAFILRVQTQHLKRLGEK